MFGDAAVSWSTAARVHDVASESVRVRGNGELTHRLPCARGSSYALSVPISDAHSCPGTTRNLTPLLKAVRRPQARVYVSTPFIPRPRTHPIPSDFVPVPWGTTGVGVAAAAPPEGAAEAATGVAGATAVTVTEAVATGAEGAAEAEGSAVAGAGVGSRTLATRRLTTGTGSSGGASGGRYGPPTST